MKKKFLSSSGFTLVESLMVIFVFTVVSGIVLSILSSVLRGANKTNVIASIRKNGDYAITQMAKNIRSAKKFEGLSIDGMEPFDNNCLIYPDSLRGQNYLKIVDFSEITRTFRCQVPTSISLDGNNFLDSTSVKVDSCSFSCTRTNASSNPIVKITFTLSQSNPDAGYEKSFSIPFQASIQLRNK